MLGESAALAHIFVVFLFETIDFGRFDFAREFGRRVAGERLFVHILVDEHDSRVRRLRRRRRCRCRRRRRDGRRQRANEREQKRRAGDENRRSTARNHRDQSERKRRGRMLAERRRQFAASIV